ncbi:hypothetical protein JIN85_13635 [Luteolibacter pohnpeiensis]|uniref:Uncharacterized protein n=1 Tax=Luteolibacter pohnpeiensis TaxID=454153 RepID=A0A934VX49_9BACT|nr:hypothetical protein [Luteolibacter pohnpeiensis]MBK1883463.1 hypothetical protein [Luteolibacter pohnpeiensis]
MNRRKSDPRTPASVYFALIAATLIAACGGMLHVYYKNQQIQVVREIDAIDRRVDQYRLDVKTTDYRMDQLLNRYAIRKQLEENSSTLCAIPLGLIEQVDPAPPARESVASATP